MPRPKLPALKRAPRWVRDPLLTLANTPKALLCTLIGSWILFSLAFAALEPEIEWFDGLYFGTVVQSTLGFGDVLPTGVATKLLVMAYVFFCIYFLLPTAIYHVAEHFVKDAKKFDDDDKAELQAQLSRIESMLLAQRNHQGAL